MKREILCLDCGKRKLPSYEGEHDKSQFGKALVDFVCDQCGREIPKGSNCYARSIWAEGRGIQYYEWEKGYIG